MFLNEFLIYFLHIINICDSYGQTLLHRACRRGYADIAEILLKRNSNINQCDKWMKTPLILAIEGRHSKVVKLLVENKCDINICDDDDGLTPLHRAFYCQNKWSFHPFVALININISFQ